MDYSDGQMVTPVTKKKKKMPPGAPKQQRQKRKKRILLYPSQKTIPFCSRIKSIKLPKMVV